VGYWIQKHITATGVSTVSISAAGILHGVVFNQVSTAAATASTGLVTVYDATTTAASTDARVIGIVSPATTASTDYIYDCEYMNGLTIQVGSAVAPLDITVLYR
jgi:hypothetical protein